MEQVTSETALSCEIERMHMETIDCSDVISKKAPEIRDSGPIRGSGFDPGHMSSVRKHGLDKNAVDESAQDLTSSHESRRKRSKRSSSSVADIKSGHDDLASRALGSGKSAEGSASRYELLKDRHDGENGSREDDILDVVATPASAKKNQLATSSGEERTLANSPSLDQPHASLGHKKKRLASIIVRADRRPRRKLLILDVNGLLADILPYPAEGYKPDTWISRKAVFKRPYCDDFLQFCFENFDVGIWSSRTRRNVEGVIDFLMGDRKMELFFCWSQEECTDTGYNTVGNKSKPLFLKEIKKLWDKEGPDLPWDKGDYNESNTILIDDSPYKALRNPPYTAIFPDPYTYENRRDNFLGPDGDLRLYLQRLVKAGNVQKFVKENAIGQRPITKSNCSWLFYSKIINAANKSDPEKKSNGKNSTSEAATSTEDAKDGTSGSSVEVHRTKPCASPEVR